MSQQITYYHEHRNISPFCARVEIALVETGARYKAHSFDIHNKPAWFAQVNQLTGKVPTITYGGPEVNPEEPSPLSFKLTESLVILEFLADTFPDSKLLPPVTNPVERARVRSFIDVLIRSVEAPMFDLHRGDSSAVDKIIAGLEKIQGLLADPDTADGGEYMFGKNFTTADCVAASIFGVLQLKAKTDLGRFEPGVGIKLREALKEERFARLRRYKAALWERESVKKVVDLDRMESVWRTLFARS